MRSHDYRNNIPIGYVVDRNSVSHQTFQKVLEIHIKAGFDILQIPSHVQKGKKPMSFWEVMILNGRMTPEIFNLIE